MTGLHRQDALAGSPFGPGFSWPKVDKPAVAAPARDVAAKPSPEPSSISPTPTTRTPPTPTQAPTASANTTRLPTAVQPTASQSVPTPIAPANGPTDAASSTDVAQAQPQPGQGSRLFEGAEIPEHPNDTATGAAQVPANMPHIRHVGFASRGFHHQVTPGRIDYPRSDRRCVRPDPATPHAKPLGADSAPPWNGTRRMWTVYGSRLENPPRSLKPWQPAGSISYPTGTNAIEKECISPDGDLVAHVSTVLSFSVLVDSYKQHRIVQSLKLQERWRGRCAGVCSNDRLLVHRLEGPRRKRLKCGM